MNFDKAVQGALDTLTLGKEGRKKDKFLFTHIDFFSEKKTALESLGLSWKQRIAFAAISALTGIFFFFRALTSVLTLAYRPEVFGFNYAAFAFFCVLMVCFFGGFKTFVTNAVSREMALYSVIFAANSALLLVGRKLPYVVNLPLTVGEIITFFLFSYNYFRKKFKMGMRGLKTFSLF